MLESSPAPGPKRKHDRLISTCADAVNYMGLRGRLVIDGCEFARMADDSLNICGITTRVLRVEDDQTFLGASRNAEDLRANDALTFAAPADLSPAGEGLLASAEVVTMPEEELKGLLAEAKFQVAESRIDDVEFVRFRLQKPVGLKVGQHVDFPAFSTGGFRVSNSYFHDHRARGLRVQVSNGTIENNCFERIQHAAITIGPEASARGLEGAGWVKNIVVRNNRILDVGREQHIAQPWSSAPAAIATDSSKFRDIKPTFPGHANITIEGNTIDGCRVSAIHACAVDGLIVQGNTISQVNTIDSTNVGSEIGIRPSHAVTVLHSRNAKVDDNRFFELNEHCLGEVWVQPTHSGESAVSDHPGALPQRETP